jgi:hypothetical protein
MDRDADRSILSDVVEWHVLPDELCRLAAGRREAEVDAERRLPDHVFGQLEGEVGEVEIVVLRARKKNSVHKKFRGSSKNMKFQKFR